MPAGTNGLPDPTQIQQFDVGATNPVDLEIGPNGDIFYPDIFGGTIHEISYSTGPSDLARDQPATASSSETGTTTPNKANDGNSGTRWSSSFADNQWWQVDLGSVKPVDRVSLNWEAAYASSYKIQVSSDGTTFTTVATVSATGPGLKTTDFAETPARYVRVLGVTRATAYGISFWDAQVFDMGSGGGGAVPVNTALPTVSGSAVQGQVLTATDGSWSGSPTSFRYQWQRCDSAGGACQPIANATIRTYLLTPSDVGWTVGVIVTATNGSGDSLPAASAVTAVVAGDLALTRPTSASSSESGSMAPNMANDGNSSTRWSSSFADNQWWQVDLGSVKPVNTVSLNWEVAYASSYKIQLSTDGSTFTTVATVSLAAAGWKTTSFTETSARYVRVLGVTRATVYGISFWDAQVFDGAGGGGGGGGAVPVNTALPTVSGFAGQGQTLTATNGAWNGSPTSFRYQWQRCDTGGGNCQPIAAATNPTYVLTQSDVGQTVGVLVTATNGSGDSLPSASAVTGIVRGDVALSRPASASSSETTALTPDKANDGNSGTRWSSSFADNQWWQVDLGSIKQVETVGLNWEAAYASSYQIQVSSDGSRFATVATVSLAAAGWKMTTFTATSARYVRVLGVTRATNNGISFYDAQVFGPAQSNAPAPVIDSPSSTSTWKVGDPITFSGHATDTADGTLPASALTWQLLLHHCDPTGQTCHNHFLQTFNGVAGGSFNAPDHDYPSYLELDLTATDSHGLSTTTSVLLHPQTVNLTLASAPAGLQLALDLGSTTTPYTATVIVGSTHSISAPTTQTLGGTSYTFSSWSDGGAATHTITAPATATTFTATYTGGSGGNSPPMAVATASPTSGTVPLTVNFDGSGSSDPDVGDTISYSWDLDGDGTFGDSTAQKPAHVYAVAGTYNAVLKVTDSHNASTLSTPITISVGVLPPPNSPPTAVATASPTSGTVPLTVNFDGSGSSDPDVGDTISYSWDLDGDGTFGDSTAQKPAHVYAVAGTYNAVLKVTDSHNASTLSTPITISVGVLPPPNSPPTAVATASPTSGTAPLTVNFDGSGSSDPDVGDTISYSWDLNGDGTFGDSTVAKPSFTYASAGTYNAVLKVTDNHNASTSSTPITINVSGGVSVFGTTTPGSGTDNAGPGYKEVSKYTAPRAGNVTKLTGYIAGRNVGTTTQAVRAVLYADAGGNPGALLGVSNEVIVTHRQAWRWVDFIFSSPVAIPAGRIWMGYFAGSATSSVVQMRYDTIGGDEKYNKNSTAYPAASNPFGTASTASAHYSLYATYGP